ASKPCSNGCPRSRNGLPKPAPIGMIHLPHGRSLLSLCRCQKQGAQLPFPEYSANFPKRKIWYQRERKDNNDEKERPRAPVADMREIFTHCLALEFSNNQLLDYIEQTLLR